MHIFYFANIIKRFLRDLITITSFVPAISQSNYFNMPLSH